MKFSGGFNLSAKGTSYFSPVAKFAISQIDPKKNDTNWGGLANTKTTCLNDLTANDLLGKASAGTLTSDRVDSVPADGLSEDFVVETR